MNKSSLMISFFLFFSLNSFSADISKYHGGMVVSENKIASQIGSDILRAGGNAIDAAVAVGYALAVVNPCCGNIGGGGFMTIHLAKGKDIFLNFREKAPLNIKKILYLDEKGKPIADKTTTGYLAVAVPGTVLGLDTALQKYGTMSRKQVMSPAIQLAERGYIITAYEAKQFQAFANDFRTQPNVASVFLKNGHSYRRGERFIQTDLANTLKLISDKGPSAFYHGPIAKAIVTASQMRGGVLTLSDFARYNVEELPPIRCDYLGYTIISAPPPSSGGTMLCEMLNILENFPLNTLGYHTAKSSRLIIEAMRYAYTDRNQLGDPHFVNNPIDQLLSKNYAQQISERIKNDTPITFNQTILNQEKTDTTHYSIMDKNGNAVAVTYSLNGFFGARVIADHTGFFLNNEMDDFSISSGIANKFGLIQSDKNIVAPGKRPLSSMTPTIITKNGKVFMVLGSPGGPRIITAVLLTILNIIDYQFSLQQAINAPRFHYQGQPDIVEAEPLAFSFLTTKRLEHMGYQISTQNTWAAIEAIMVNPNNELTGANDNRRPDGAAIGYFGTSSFND